MWIYSVSRVSGLAVIINFLINSFNTSPINCCQAWVTSCWAFSALGGYGLSSMLIMLRIYAIWDKSKVIMAISTVIWVINLGFQLAGILKIRAEWVPTARSCVITNVQICRGFYLNLLITDVILLFIMLAGLLRLRRSVGSFYLSQLLWKQGVIWLTIATAAELPQMLLLFFNVNESLDVLFLTPSMVAIILAATRTYRSLILSASFLGLHHGEPDSINLQNIKRSASHTKDFSVVHMPSNPVEVMVLRAHHEEYPMSETNHHGSHPSSDVRSSLRATRAPDENVEGGGEKQ